MKESIVEIPRGSGNKYRYSYEDGQTRYLGPVGSAPSISEELFAYQSTIAMLKDEIESHRGRTIFVDAIGDRALIGDRFDTASIEKNIKHGFKEDIVWDDTMNISIDPVPTELRRGLERRDADLGTIFRTKGNFKVRYMTKNLLARGTFSIEGYDFDGEAVNFDFEIT